MDLQHIALSSLKIATVNVRHARKSPDVSDILPSIRARGILQPLLVRPNGKGFEIVAGRRRFFAASVVAQEQGASPDEVQLPCAVIGKGDEPRRKRSSSEGEGDTEGSSKARPELTKAAENYLALHRHAIVRAELLARPGVALRLAVAHMVAGSPLWSVKPEPQRADKEAIAASLTASRAQTVFETERQAILQLFDLEPSYLGTVTWSNGDSFRAASVFARLLELPDETVLRVLTLLMAETLSAGSALVEAVGVLVKLDVTKWWELDETFLDLIRDRGAVQAMLSEIAGQAIADANVSETAKVQKKIIMDYLKGEGRDKVEGFVPRYLAFPIASYDPAKTMQIASDWEIVKALFTGK